MGTQRGLRTRPVEREGRAGLPRDALWSEVTVCTAAVAWDAVAGGWAQAVPETNLGGRLEKEEINAGEGGLPGFDGAGGCLLRLDGSWFGRQHPSPSAFLISRWASFLCQVLGHVPTGPGPTLLQELGQDGLKGPPSSGGSGTAFLRGRAAPSLPLNCSFL